MTKKMRTARRKRMRVLRKELGKDRLTHQKRWDEASHFIAAVGQNLMSSLLYGPKNPPPSRPLTMRDVTAALAWNRSEILDWIHAISDKHKYQRKPTKKFFDEWRANLWDLADYIIADKHPNGMSFAEADEIQEFNGLAARYSSLSSSHAKPQDLEALVAGFGETVIS